ncbi:hypothetical protein V6N13_000897 [Hibiscus sabdariffa]|uniref:Uncharacterized protein n=1 Tax=Hibiscus sabdariffa TaxID=183260 RepID=A0ABR2G7G2_9ROSI
MFKFSLILPGSFGGRPPETLTIPVELSLLERHGSPISFESQPIAKKERYNPESLLAVAMEEEQQGTCLDINMG